MAKLYGSILTELGLLSKGEVVVKNPSDFLGSVLGESEKKVGATLAGAGRHDQAAPAACKLDCVGGESEQGQQLPRANANGVYHLYQSIIWLPPAGCAQTNAILDSTLGCVLVIDEAYGLHSDKSKDPYKAGPGGGCDGQMQWKSIWPAAFGPFAFENSSGFCASLTHTCKVI